MNKSFQKIRLLIIFLVFGILFGTINGDIAIATQKRQETKTKSTKASVKVENNRSKEVDKGKQSPGKKKNAVKKTLYEPNTIVHKGNKVKFVKSKYDYYETKDSSSETLEKRYKGMVQEIKNKNIIIGPEFDGEDDKSNYIMGHNPGTMSKIAKLAVGDSIFVTDSKGKTYEYVIVDHVDVYKTYKFDNGSGDVGDILYYGYEGEAVTIQYCINHRPHSYLAIPRARFDKENTKKK